jgi:hypothetical protein
MNIELWLRCISTFSTFGIGVLLAFIAYRQSKISLAKLKFDLYERRLKVFNIVMTFIASIFANGNVEMIVLHQFLYDTNECEFLFGKDVCKYIEVLHRKGKEIHYANLKLERRMLGESDRSEITGENLELANWFDQQLKEARKIFSKDLTIKSLR